MNEVRLTWRWQRRAAAAEALATHTQDLAYHAVRSQSEASMHANAARDKAQRVVVDRLRRERDALTHRLDSMNAALHESQLSLQSAQSTARQVNEMQLSQIRLDSLHKRASI